MHRDWFDWASLIFNTLATSAGVVGLFIAIRAYKLTQAQNRLTHELALLNQLQAIIDKPNFVGRMTPHLKDRDYRRGVSQYFMQTGVTVRLMHLSRSLADEMPTWYYFAAKVRPFKQVYWIKREDRWLRGVKPERAADRINDHLQIELKAAISMRPGSS
ncbi:hypothetical protein [Micromonospora chersina]|uniref:hypothetical protein n=1 Tax=Micromonospora chersina TaxID=47854 RepID=UPI00371CF176